MDIKALQKDLEYKARNGWESITDDPQKIMDYSEAYKSFLSENKTERECTRSFLQMATDNGFHQNTSHRFFQIHKEKNIILCKIGNKPLTEGIKLIVGHIDCPRLDLKPHPLYEDSDLAFLKTHYYGGIKKYQWVTRALALHGIVILKTGEKIDITIGEKETDPVFFISDLLPHLSSKSQEEKKSKETIEGEKLNIIIGNKPFPTDEDIKDKVKLNILKHLNDKYGIKEADFTTAELEVVPAEKARDVGLDRSLIGSYGQDDRVCSYAAFKALLDIQNQDDTCLVWLVDKEEIGSDGNTGAKSSFIKQVLKKVFEIKGEKISGLNIDTCLFHSKAISADVTGALEPDWKDAFEAKNSSKIGFGVSMEKYGGSKGKSGSSDANAEYIAHLRNVFDENGVIWQTGELGKIDEGGGGTVAKFLAEYGMDIVDIGTPLLSMHAPMEVASKLDIFMTYKAYKIFFEKA